MRTRCNHRTVSQTDSCIHWYSVLFINSHAILIFTVFFPLSLSLCLLYVDRGVCRQCADVARHSKINVRSCSHWLIGTGSICEDYYLIDCIANTQYIWWCEIIISININLNHFLKTTAEKIQSYQTLYVISVQWYEDLTCPFLFLPQISSAGSLNCACLLHWHWKKKKHDEMMRSASARASHHQIAMVLVVLVSWTGARAGRMHSSRSYFLHSNFNWNEDGEKAIRRKVERKW